MKLNWLLVVLAATLSLSGCTTYQGGVGDDHEAWRGSYTIPGPAVSSTFRPGINPNDIPDRMR